MQHFGISSPLVSYCSNVFSSDDSRKHRGVPWWLCTRWWRYPSVILLWLVVKPKYRSCHKISDINFTKCDGHHRTLPAACNMCNIESPKETHSAKCHISSSHFRCCELFMCVFFLFFSLFLKTWHTGKCSFISIYFDCYITYPLHSQITIMISLSP